MLKVQKIRNPFKMNENPCKDCINKVYIDKVYSLEKVDYKTIITIQQIPFSRRDFIKLKPTPLLSVDIDSTTFFIFSGLEDYFTVSQNKSDSTNMRFISSSFFPVIRRII